LSHARREPGQARCRRGAPAGIRPGS
jgi:hypothetical protein